MTFGNIQSLIFLWTKTTENSLTDANLNLLVDVSLDHVVSLILQKDSVFQYDDSNQSGLPSATTTITADQQDYSLATGQLTIDRVELADSGGAWSLLTPIDKSDIRFQALAQVESDRSGAYRADTGLPREYDAAGNTIFLYPVPNYTRAASLKLYFTRGALKFDYTDDKFTDDTGSASSVPGFNELFHSLIPLWSAYNYWIVNKPIKANPFMVEILKQEDKLETFYGGRKRDRVPRLTTSDSQSSFSVSGRLNYIGGDSNR